MNTIRRTSEFDVWLKGLRDPIAVTKILKRLERAVGGNFGDVKPVGEGISEMRIDWGPGYRLYYKRSGNVVYVVLCGGDKSAQQADIEFAKELARQYV
ncbi:type II toxin-antitoxin system RelE/ParE family toxin [Paraburkholderia sediminicola]|uniref:type II toxin-antitoxin system RelE/ParE family toxin n=1 Tax=Paraburkholderia sediminicola TaxID=458836 RepID=UPI0038BD77F2